MPEHSNFQRKSVDTIIIKFAFLKYLRLVFPLAPNRFLISSPFQVEQNVRAMIYNTSNGLTTKNKVIHPKVPGCRESVLGWLFSGESVLYCAIHERSFSSLFW